MRSIDELFNEEAENGYTNMTDEEISALIEYKTERAAETAAAQERLKQSRAEMERQKEAAEDEYKKCADNFWKIVNDMF